jgi:hypothetical protein
VGVGEIENAIAVVGRGRLKSGGEDERGRENGDASGGERERLTRGGRGGLQRVNTVTNFHVIEVRLLLSDDSTEFIGELFEDEQVLRGKELSLLERNDELGLVEVNGSCALLNEMSAMCSEELLVVCDSLSDVSIDETEDMSELLFVRE